MQPRPGTDFESMLARHGAFVRRVAGSLVLDESRAEDVAQETWLAAARHPPREAGIRAWLATVARNFAFKLGREDARRRRREERVARPEASGAPRSALEGAILREVVDAVLALEEPYRSTVLMRFYENLAPTEIAARLGVPAATVRTRLKRALDRLREQLDAAHGERRAWALALVPLTAGAFPPAAAAAAAGAGTSLALSSNTATAGVAVGGILMMKKLAIAGGIVAAVTVAVLVATRSEPTPPAPAGPPPIVAETPEQGSAAPQVAARTLAPIEATPYVPTDEDREVPEMRLAAKGAPSAAVRGRVVDRGGMPLAGVPVTLTTTMRIAGEGRMLDSEMADESRLHTRTDDRGVFGFTQLPVGIEVDCRARPEMLCDVTRAASLPGPGSVDLGDMIALPGGSVAGIVLGPDGSPVVGCTVTAWPADASVHGTGGLLGIKHALGPDARSVKTQSDGRYRIDGLPDGASGVAVDCPSLAGDSRAGVRVRTGEVTWDVDFELAAGSTLAGVVKDHEGRPLSGVSVRAAPAETRIDGAPKPRPKTATTGADGRFLVRGLANEGLFVRATKPGFISEVLQDVLPGRDVALTLRPAGVAFGFVRNAVTGDGLSEFTVRIIDPRFGAWPIRPRIVRGADAAVAAGVTETQELFAVVDMPATPVEILVQADGFADARLGPVRVDSGQRIDVGASLEPQALVRGVVVDAFGTSVGGATVDISNAPADEELGPGGIRFRRRVLRREGGEGDAPPPVGRSVTTGPDGTFVIEALPKGSYRLYANHREHARGEPVEVELRSGEAREGVTLALAAGGTLAGRTFDAEGRPLAGARVLVRLEGAHAALGLPGSGPAISNAQGDFEVPGLAPGEYLASLAEPSSGSDMIHIAMDTGPQAARPEETAVTIVAGKITRVDLRLRKPASLRGSVEEGGRAAKGIRVSLLPKGWPELLGNNATHTDGDGAFSFGRVAPGDYVVVVDPPGAPVPVRRAVTLAPGEDLRVDVDLPTGAIEGRVVDRATRAPVAGVTLTAALTSGDESDEEARPETAVMITAVADEEIGAGARIVIGGPGEPIRTDADGRFRLRYLAGGTYRVSIRGAGVMPQSQDAVVVEEGKTTGGCDFASDQGATLFVEIDPGASGATDVFGFVEVPGRPGTHGMSSGTVKDGLRFKGLAPGRYRVRVDAPMQDVEGTAEVDVSGGEARVKVRLGAPR